MILTHRILTGISWLTRLRMWFAGRAMSVVTPPREDGFAYFKVRECRNGIQGFVAWGSLVPLVADGPCLEPETPNPVYFCFEATEDRAVAKLILEMETAHGKRRWWRQGV